MIQPHRASAALALLLSVSAPAMAHAQTPEAMRHATEAYARLNAGNLVPAIEAARLAVAASPDHLDYRLLLADAQVRAGQPAEAYQTLEPVRGLTHYRVQTRRAEAATGANLTSEAAEAFAAAAPLAPDPESRAYLVRARLFALISLERRADARTEFDEAWSSGVLPGPAPLDAAMLAIAVGRDDAAQDAFAEVEKTTPLAGRNALDAGYGARRLGRDADAIRFFSQGLDSLSKTELSSQQRFEVRREIETLSRRWGGTASLSRGVTSTEGAITPAADTVTQAGGEAYYRLGGYNSGRPVDVFVRAFTTLESDLGGATGNETTQGWVGVRWKPLAETNLVLEASKMFAIGDLARDDIMLRAAWSIERGGDLRFDRDTWPSWRLYADVARIVDDEQTLGVIDGRAGWTRRIGDRDLVTAGFGARAYYDSALADASAVGAGPRVAWRHWFREGQYAAPASYVDLSLGYDFSLAGGERGRGLSALLTVSY